MKESNLESKSNSHYNHNSHTAITTITAITPQTFPVNRTIKITTNLTNHMACQKCRVLVLDRRRTAQQTKSHYMPCGLLSMLQHKFEQKADVRAKLLTRSQNVTSTKR